MNKELLFHLYEIHSPSGSEKKMRRFLRKIANECGADSVETDKNGNLLIIKGKSETYPCLAAHMDQVQRNHSKDFKVFEHNDIVFAYSSKSMSQQGLGADDKNGIFVCLECLRKYDVLKVAFFVGEEVGCQGSGNVDLEFFKDCRFIVQPDRKGGHDLITDMFCGDVCSDDFVKALGAEQFGYKHDSGSITDVGELVERGVGISCLNLSCGYYDAHTDEEVTSLSELENCLNFVEHIIETCTDVYHFEYDYAGYYSYGRYGLYGNNIGNKHGDRVYDDYMYYFDGGYYDEDYMIMQDCIESMPDITFDMIKAYCMQDFNAFTFFDSKECENQLSDIFYDVKSYMTDEFLDNEDDDVVGEISFDDVKLEPKKVS